VVEHLPSNHEALSLNPNTVKKRKKKLGWIWWYTPVIPALRRWMLMDL
jgi:hypothetical protein